MDLRLADHCPGIPIPSRILRITFPSLQRLVVEVKISTYLVRIFPVVFGTYLTPLFSLKGEFFYVECRL